MRRRVKLPHGYRVTFVWHGDGSMDAEWEPDMPPSAFETARGTRRFYGAYELARDSFLRDVATIEKRNLLRLGNDGVAIINQGTIN